MDRDSQFVTAYPPVRRTGGNRPGRYVTVILVGRMSVPAELENQFNDAYPDAGVLRVNCGPRFEAVMDRPSTATVHEEGSPCVYRRLFPE